MWKCIKTPGKVQHKPVQEHPDSLHKVTIGIEHDQLSMRLQCKEIHSIVACALLWGRRGSDNRRGGYNTVTHVHVVTIRIKHDRLTMNRQNMARHGVTACAKEGERRGEGQMNGTQLWKMHRQENHWTWSVFHCFFQSKHLCNKRYKTRWNRK